MNITHGHPRGVRNRKAQFAFGTKIAGEHRRISGYDSDDPQFYHQNGAGAGLPALDPKMVRLPEKPSVQKPPVKERGHGIARDQAQYDSSQDDYDGVKSHDRSGQNVHSAPGIATQKHSR